MACSMACAAGNVGSCVTALLYLFNSINILILFLLDCHFHPIFKDKCLKTLKFIIRNTALKSETNLHD